MGICTGCPTPPTTAPPPLATTTTTAATTATTAKPAPNTTSAKPKKISATLNRAADVPKVKSVKKGAKPPTGKFSGIISGDSLSWTMTTANAPAVVRVRIREGAPGKVGPVIIALGPVEGADADVIALSDDQEFRLRNSRLFVEAVTDANPAGEMRGQLH